MNPAPFRPFFVGVAGGTGSGKTTVAQSIGAALPADQVAMVCHDNYYRDRGDIPLEERAQLNYDHPDSLDNDLLAEHLRLLREGQPVESPQYDYVTHRRTAETQHIAPAPVVIVEGILVFVKEPIRSQLDLKIFVDTDADIRIMRRVRRDLEQRGRDFASVRKQYYDTVRPMHIQFVEPSKQWADLIIPEGGRNKVALETIVGRLLYNLSAN